MNARPAPRATPQQGKHNSPSPTINVTKVSCAPNAEAIIACTRILECAKRERQKRTEYSMTPPDASQEEFCPIKAAWQLAQAKSPSSFATAKHAAMNRPNEVIQLRLNRSFFITKDGPPR